MLFIFYRREKSPDLKKEDENGVKKEDIKEEEHQFEKPSKKEPLSLEELLAKKQAEEAARSKVNIEFFVYIY